MKIYNSVEKIFHKIVFFREIVEFFNNIFYFSEKIFSMEKLKPYFAHIIAFLGFILVSLIYFYPVLQGKEIFQNDIVQYIGMARETNEHREVFQEESYWNNSAFGGMPTYQLGAKYPHNYIKKVDSVLRFLPRPADYLFLYFIGFYVLLCSLRVKPLQSFIGALLFGFSTYLIIIIGAGHNAKAHAIAYMPLLIAGIVWVFQRNLWLGGIIAFFGASLEIQANHFQMTYYLLFLIAILIGFFTLKAIKNQQFVPYIKRIGILSIAAILAVGVNATNLMATSEYAKFSTRSTSELTLNPDGSPKENSNVMSREYITEYSYGIFETLNLVSSKVTGGANHENIGTNSNSYKFLAQYDPEFAKDFSENAATYWGAQPIVAAPAYIGAVVVFLAILGLYIEKRRIKYAFLAGAVVSIVLSWGKHFFLTDLLIDYLPMYDKFRAIASIQVIAELCIPVLAVLGLKAYFESHSEEQKEALKKTAISFGGIFILLILGYVTSNFQSANDGYYAQMLGEDGYRFVENLIADRKSMYLNDLLRTFVFVAISGGILFVVIKNEGLKKYGAIVLGLLAVVDLVMIDKQYVNNENFVAVHIMKNPFQNGFSPADEMLKQDTTHFRVFDAKGMFNSASASYFYQNFGGYHAAKPKKVQELMDYQLQNDNAEILNMYNVKYIFVPQEQGLLPMLNEDANGNAWFVSEVKTVNNADELMQKMKSFDSKKTALVEKKFANGLKNSYAVDSLANIQMVKNLPNELVYKTQNTNDGLAVFAENYYPKGWQITIDNQPVEMLEVNHTLRALPIPAGTHTVTFKFEPEVIKTGSTIALIFSIVSLLFVIGLLALGFRPTRCVGTAK